MSEMSELVEVANGPTRNCGTVVFVHGLDGDPLTTWGGASIGDASYWPAWIAEHYPEYCVLSVGYPAAKTRFKGHAMAIIDRADNILDLLMVHPAAAQLRTRPVAFIGHSMGGLVIKQLILTAVKRGRGDAKLKEFIEQLTQVAFIATPHDGASLAKIAILFRIASAAAVDLARDDERLMLLASDYRNLEHETGIRLRHTVYYEKRDTTFANLRIVDKDSSDPKLPGVYPVPIDADHFNICRPTSREGEGANVFLSICDMLQHLASGRAVADTRQIVAQTAPAAAQTKVIAREFLRSVDGFTGREAELAALEKSLWDTAGHAVAVTNRHTGEVAVLGDAGVGKSALAIQYAYLNANRYAGAWFVRAQNRATLLEDLIAFGKLIHVPHLAEKADDEERARAVVSHIEEKAGEACWLLVFDNVDEYSVLRKIIPDAGAHVLITTRFTDVAALAKMPEMPVGVLSEDQAVAYLLGKLRDDRPLEVITAEARSLARALGRLPLALRHARGHHMRYGTRFSTYERNLAKYLINDSGASADEKTVFASYSETIEAAIARAPLAWDLLVLWAFLDPERIPEDLVPDSAMSEVDREAAIGALFAVSACQRVTTSSGPAISLHRLEQFVVRARLKQGPNGAEQYARAAANATQIIINAWAAPGNVLAADAAAIDRRSFLAPHAASAVNWSSDNLGPHADFLAAGMCQELTNWHSYKGNRDTARRYCELALAAFSRLLSQDPDRKFYRLGYAEFSAQMADLDVEVGNRAAARTSLLTACVIMEDLEVAYPQDLTVKRTLTAIFERIADLDVAAGERVDARKRFERALEICEELVTISPDNSDYQRDLTVPIERIADLDAAAGDHLAARKGYERSLKIRDELAETHPNVPSYQSALTVPLERIARLDAAAGDRAAARKGYERSLRICEQLADTHPDVPEYQRGLTVPIERIADLDVAAGDRASARKGYERSLKIRQKLADSHPNLPDYQCDLTVPIERIARLDAAAGDRAAARKGFERSLAICEALVQKHPEVPDYQRSLTSPIEQIADLDAATGNRAAARKGYERSLKICQKLADAHPDVPGYQSDLTVPIEHIANLDAATGDRASARKGYERSLKIREALAEARPDMPDYQRGLTVPMNRLADLDVAEGDRAAARKKIERSLAICQKLADAHPDVPDYQRGLAVIKYKQALVEVCDGDLQAAVQKFTAILNIARTLRGRLPDVLSAVDAAEYTLWLSLAEPAAQHAEARAELARLAVLDCAKEDGSLPRKQAAIAAALSQMAISAGRRKELVTCRDELRGFAKKDQLDTYAKEWLALVETALDAPPPGRRGIFSWWK